MKKIVAQFFLFIFISFIGVPSVVVLIDERVDVSFAYTANEEENSKKHVEIDLTVNTNSNGEAILFLQEQNLSLGYDTSSNYLVHLDVLSPLQNKTSNFRFFSGKTLHSFMAVHYAMQIPHFLFLWSIGYQQAVL